MVRQPKIFDDFQSHLVNLFVELAEQLNSLTDYLLLIEKCCLQDLSMSRCCFLVYEGETLCHTISSTYGLVKVTTSSTVMSSYFTEQKCVKIPSELKAEPLFSDFHYMICLQDENKINGIFLFELSDQIELQSFIELELLMQKLFRYAKYMSSIQQNEQQYRKLFNVTDVFHSTMEMDYIIENVLKIVEQNFASFAVDLILSNDQDRHTTIKVKPFDYLSERTSITEAFVSGEITTELATDLELSLLNVPIKGRQAIYGILQISAPPTYTFTETEKDFVRMLCTASGNALENAKLYHQSHRLISDLQLINETTHRLNMKLTIEEMFEYLKKQLFKSFQPMELCFVLIEDHIEKIADASTPFFKTDESMQYIEYVKKHFLETLDPLFIADFARVAQAEVDYKSMMAIPMLMHERINGYAIVLHEQSYFFSFDSYKLMQSLIHHSSLAISNSILRNKLQEMVERDHLTKLYARNYLDENVEQSLMNDHSGMFMLIDIDNFKHVNDTYGHQVGDEVLVQIASQLKQVIGKQGICARWGGEELAVYMPNIERQEAVSVAQKIVAQIPLITQPIVTISSGLITWESSNRPAFQEIFLHADKALYAAKNNGKNQVCLFSESLFIQ